MEYRKIFLSGKASYIISLPKRWIKRMQLKPGDLVIVEEENSKLIIYPKEIGIRYDKEVSISVKDYDMENILREVIAYYLSGVNKIKVDFSELDRKNDVKDFLRKIPQRLIGVEILEEYENYILFEIVLDDNRLKINEILRKMATIIKSMLQELKESLSESNNETVRDILSKENTVDKLYFLLVRKIKTLLNQGGKDEVEDLRDLLGYRIVAKSLERISDHIENISKSLLNLKEMRYSVSNDIKEIISDVITIYEKTISSLLIKQINEDIFKTCYNLKMKCDEIILNVGCENKTEMINVTMIIYSLKRIISYLTDIAEISLNISINKKLKD